MNAATYQFIELALLAANGAFEAVVAYSLLPERLRHNSERRERAARIALNLEALPPHRSRNPLFGLDQQLNSIPDIIDHLHHPERYSDLHAGNEILIVGPAQSGKKTLAFEIAKRAKLDQVIIIHNPRDEDVLAHAASLLQNKPVLWKQAAREITGRAPRRQKIMLLIPGLDHINGHSGQPWMDQLEGLIETAATMPNVLIVGTAQQFYRNGEIANWFGTALPIPGMQPVAATLLSSNGEGWKRMMSEVASGYMRQARRQGFTLAEMVETDFIAKILAAAINPAEIQDIVNNCQSLAIHAGYDRSVRAITPAFLDKAIGRVTAALAP